MSSVVSVGSGLDGSACRGGRYAGGTGYLFRGVSNGSDQGWKVGSDRSMSIVRSMAHHAGKDQCRLPNKMAVASVSPVVTE